MYEAVKGKPKLQWRQQPIGDAGALGRSREEPEHRKWLQPQREPTMLKETELVEQRYLRLLEPRRYYNDFQILGLEIYDLMLAFLDFGLLPKKFFMGSQPFLLSGMRILLCYCVLRVCSLVFTL